MSSVGGDDTPTTTGSNPGRPFTIVGFVLAAIALLFFPIFLGPAGAIFGGVGYAKGDRPLGMWALVAGIVGGIAGMALGAALVSNS